MPSRNSTFESVAAIDDALHTDNPRADVSAPTQQQQQQQQQHQPRRPSRSRPRPRFWIVDDFETCMVPFTPTTPSAAYLKKILAQRSVPIDDEPTMSEKSRPQRARGKLLPKPDYYPGFGAKIESDSGNASTWPWSMYESGDEYPSPHHVQRRRAIWRRLLLVFTLIVTAAYGAYQMSYLAHYYTNAAMDAPQPTWRSPSADLNPASADTIGIDSWIKKEAHSALRAVLANIGPAAGAADGIVVASPSTGDADEPDYYYTWTRDAGLTVSALLPYFIPDGYLTPWELAPSAPGSQNHSHPLVEALVRSYVAAQSGMQVSPNPSGDLYTGGLSEPKFTTTGAPFRGPWGRPQRDGPALRALALIPYANWLLDRGYAADKAYVAEHLYDTGHVRAPGSVIKNDLEEVAHAWSAPGFDLWEEVLGDHLWTLATSRRALQAGARLASRLGDSGAANFYSSAASDVAAAMQKFKAHDIWNATLPTPEGRDGLDAGTILAAVHTGGNDSLAATHTATLSTLHAYVRAFADLYPVNNGSWTAGWLVGRYNTDIYDGKGFTGGNPWYIATYSVAHVLYAAAEGFARAGRVDFAAGAFWADLGVSEKNSTAAAVGRLQEVGDAFVAAAARTITGGMSEQIGRTDGVPRGARDLTWSYASFLEMKRARDRAKAAVAAVGL